MMEHDGGDVEVAGHWEHAEQPKCVLIVAMGVSGTGKSTLGSGLAKELGMPFVEGDDLHPKSNVDKMSAGVPLNDQDREPWLKLIRATVENLACELQEKQQQQQRQGNSFARGKPLGVVVGCSALKKYYRDILRGRRRFDDATSEEDKDDKSDLPGESLKGPGPDTEVLPTYFVFIEGPREVLYERMEKRPGHFMKASMLDSQLSTLESPVEEDGVVTVPVDISTEEQIRTAKKGLAKWMEL